MAVPKGKQRDSRDDTNMAIEMRESSELVWFQNFSLVEI